MLTNATSLSAYFHPSLDDTAIHGFVAGIEAETSSKPVVWQPANTSLRLIGHSMPSNVEGIYFMFHVAVQLLLDGKYKRSLAFAQHLTTDADIANLINLAIANIDSGE